MHFFGGVEFVFKEFNLNSVIPSFSGGRAFIHLRHPIPSFKFRVLSGPGGPISGKGGLERVIIGPNMGDIRGPREFRMRRHAQNGREYDAPMMMNKKKRHYYLALGFFYFFLVDDVDVFEVPLVFTFGEI